MNETPTLAERLGATPRVSPVLQKAKRLRLNVADLEQLAIERGCDYYDVFGAKQSPGAAITDFTNAELAIALLNPALPYAPHTIRLGAAMLSAEDNSPEEIAKLAQAEHCVPVVRYIAEAGRKFEPNNSFWTDLLNLLPASEPVRSGVLPHPTRFVAMTGFTRHGPETIIEWIRPHRREALHG
jgi:hypothetical protein